MRDDWRKEEKEERAMWTERRVSDVGMEKNKQGEKGEIKFWEGSLTDSE
jgi:hypothetical protein